MTLRDPGNQLSTLNRLPPSSHCSRGEFAPTDRSKEFTMHPIVTRRMIALAALLASTLMAACGPRSTNPSSETLTVYQDAPTLNLLDLCTPGRSPGDVHHFFAPLHASPGGPVTGEVFGTKTLVNIATDANLNLELRTTSLSVTVGEH